MAWTINREGCIIELIPDGASNFVWTTAFPDEPQGVKIESIQVYFSAAADEIEMRTHSTSGPRMFKYTSITGESVAKTFYGGLFKPVIVHAEQVYGTPANFLVVIQTT
jgi:hypothetical protein